MVVGLIVYLRPIPLWSDKYALASLQRLDDYSDSSELFLDFQSVSRAKLAFLLRGVIISELASFSNNNQAFPLSLIPLPNGHYSLHDNTLFVFFRPSKTVQDFYWDLNLRKTPCERGGYTFSGPTHLANRAYAFIKELADKSKIEKIVLSGASLGSSISAILAERIISDQDMTNEVQLIMFNPFGVGDAKFLKQFEKRIDVAFNVRNINDAIAAAFDARLGVPILFDYRCDNKTAAHCSIADMLFAMGEDDEIEDKSFYFSDG